MWRPRTGALSLGAKGNGSPERETDAEPQLGKVRKGKRRMCNEEQPDSPPSDESRSLQELLAVLSGMLDGVKAFMLGVIGTAIRGNL